MSIKIGGQAALNATLNAVGAVIDTAIEDDGNTSPLTYVSSAVSGALVGAAVGALGGNGTATKHMTNSFKRALGNGNWSYFISQVGVESRRAGIKAIPGIIRSAIPSALNVFYNYTK